MSRVIVDQLCVSYGDVVAVDGMSFTAEPGAVTVVLGPNGAGKTTTIECLEGYRRPVSGSVRIDGLDPLADHHELSRRVGVMLQDGGVYTGIRVMEVLRLFAAYYDDPLPPEELVARVGLDHRRSATWRSLSGGEQQRLSLALALIGRPDVAFLDEPTAGVDIRGKQVIRDVIRELRDDGVTVVLTTHDLDEAEELADRIIIVDRGRVVADGTPDELLDAAAADHFSFRADPGLDLDSLSRSIDATVHELTPGDYRVESPPTPSAVAAVTSWLADNNQLLDDLRAGRHRLDDVFLALTREADAVTDPSAVTGRSRRGRRRRDSV